MQKMVGFYVNDNNLKIGVNSIDICNIILYTYTIQQMNREHSGLKNCLVTLICPVVITHLLESQKSRRNKTIAVFEKKIFRQIGGSFIYAQTV